MLGHTFRLRASNTQNQAITASLKARFWKLSGAGALVYSSEQTLVAATSVAATVGSTASATVDNSSDLWLGADLALSCTAATTTNGTGTVAVYLERSTDGGTTWPTPGQGEFVGAYTVLAADGTNVRLKNLSVD